MSTLEKRYHVPKLDPTTKSSLQVFCSFSLANQAKASEHIENQFLRMISQYGWAWHWGSWILPTHEQTRLRDMVNLQGFGVTHMPNPSLSYPSRPHIIDHFAARFAGRGKSPCRPRGV